MCVFKEMQWSIVSKAIVISQKFGNGVISAIKREIRYCKHLEAAFPWENKNAIEW
jgi:hypothetical protein